MKKTDRARTQCMITKLKLAVAKCGLQNWHPHSKCLFRNIIPLTTFLGVAPEGGPDFHQDRPESVNFSVSHVTNPTPL